MRLHLSTVPFFDHVTLTEMSIVGFVYLRHVQLRKLLKEKEIRDRLRKIPIEEQLCSDNSWPGTRA